MLADDSGLEVDALDGRPGVITAYYGGEHLTWPQRREYVLSELIATATAMIAARGSCAICISSTKTAARRPWMRRSSGTIAMRDRGERGFGFDPIFVYPAAQKTFSELDGDGEERRESSPARGLRTVARIAKTTNAQGFLTLLCAMQLAHDFDTMALP